MTEILIQELGTLGIKVITDKENHFDTITLDSKASGFSSSDYVLAEFHKYGINLRKVDDNVIGISLSELTTMVDLDEIIEVFADLLDKRTSVTYLTDTFYIDQKYKGLTS